MTISMPLDVAHAIVVSLDGQPIAKSKKMLLQVMTEEKGTGFRSEPIEGRRNRIVSIGESPWLVKKIEGQVKFHRTDAGKLKVTALDQYGEPAASKAVDLSPGGFTLQPETLYYSIAFE